MGLLFTLPVLLQLVVPLALLAWLGVRRHRSRAQWVLVAVLTAAYGAVIAMAGMWLVVPPAMLGVLAILFAIALTRSWARVRERRAAPGGVVGWVALLLTGTIALLVVGLALHLSSGRRAPEGEMVELAMPLEGGRYWVANGGNLVLLNAHALTLRDEERFRPYRGQGHGVDIVRLRPWGMRAFGVLPSDPAKYEIFGEPVVAPCDGRVVRAEDGLLDLSPPATDRERLAGNHVVLECGGVWVLLAHLARGSVSARAGEELRVGHPVGRVGNSGNTSEPHLHVHAQRPGTPESPFAGEPIPIRIAGRYPVRNGVLGGR